MTALTRKRITTVLVAFVITFAMLAFSQARLASAESAPSFAGASVTLDKDVVLNYSLVGLNSDEDYVVKFTYRENTYEKPVTVDAAGKATVAFEKITPQYIDQNVKAELVAGGETIAEKAEYSVKEYLYELLGKTEEQTGLSCERYAAMRALAVDTLYYAEAAQAKYLTEGEYVGVTAAMTASEKALATEFVALEDAGGARKLTGVKSDAYAWKSAGIRFDYNVSLYFEITVAEDAEWGMTVDGEAATLSARNGSTLKFRYENVSLLDFDKNYSVKVLKNGEEEGQTLVYSVNGYVYAMQNDSDMSNIVRKTYNYGVAAETYATAANEHALQLKFGSAYTEAEATLGTWQTCEHCGKKTYVQYATAVNNGGITKNYSHALKEMVLTEGADPTLAASYAESSNYLNFSNVAYNVTNLNAPQTFEFPVTVEKAGVYELYLRMRNTNKTSDTFNSAYELNKTLSVTVNDSSVAIGDDVVLAAVPELGGAGYWQEYAVAKLNLTAGENSVKLVFSLGERDSSGKARGGYLQYMRLEEAATGSNCENGDHNLTFVAQKEATCAEYGENAHYACLDCGKLFDKNRNEVSAESLRIEKTVHHYDVCLKTDANEHSKKCVACDDILKETHTTTEAGRYLVVARRPNRVWYYEGETLKDVEEDVVVEEEKANGATPLARMKLYTSTLCADGCGELTEYTGEYTVTYQHGNAFTEGDTYVTLTAVVNGEAYTGKLDGLTVVKTAADMLNVDDAGMSFDAATQAKQRHNDQYTGTELKVGQAAYGGYYLNQIKRVSFTFTATKSSGRLALQLSTSPVDGLPAGGMFVADELKVTLNGKQIDISKALYLKGTVAGMTGRWAWTVWETVDLGTVALNEGENVLVIENAGTHAYSQIDLDCFNIFY